MGLCCLCSSSPQRVHVKHRRLQLSQLDGCDAHRPDVAQLVVAAFNFHCRNLWCHPDNRRGKSSAVISNQHRMYSDRTAHNKYEFRLHCKSSGTYLALKFCHFKNKADVACCYCTQSITSPACASICFFFFYFVLIH